ncbi:MAG TPA: LysR family transcriptional regulator [Terriglobales bacterium]|nr:LysR family transcriptional regulator [Terriglobales bacterium]
MFIRQFSYLVALAREKHFARAAAACNVTQPTLSAGIQKLERELGLPVIERGHHFIGLTPEGERVLNWARRIIADFDGLKQDLANFGQGLSGTLRLGAIPAALPTVSLLTGPFCARHPGVAVQVQSMTSIAIQRDLDTFDLDAGLTYLENEPLNHVQRVPLYTERYMFVAKTELLKGIPAAMSWAEAATYPLCLLQPDMQNRRIINQIFQEIGIRPKPRIETNSYDGILAHVRHGAYCSILPHPHCQSFSPAEGISTLPLVDPIRTQSIGLVTADRDPLLPVTAAFMHFAAGLNLDHRYQG